MSKFGDTHSWFLSQKKTHLPAVSSPSFVHDCCYDDNHVIATVSGWSIKNSQLSTSKPLYLRDGATQSHSYR